MKEIISKLEFIKIKNFYSVKDSRELEDNSPNEHKKRWHTFWVKEIQIKTRMRYHFTSITMAKISNTRKNAEQGAFITMMV